jgi:4-hydroxy-tetrahydrodipicolinate synthase
MVEGAKGVISVAANVVPRMMAKLCDYALDKEVEACKDVNEKLSTLYDVLSLESNPIPVKWALHKMQRIENELRLPLLSLQSKNQPALEEALANLSLL